LAVEVRDIFILGGPNMELARLLPPTCCCLRSFAYTLS
jgi:hypothetical protein